MKVITVRNVSTGKVEAHRKWKKKKPPTKAEIASIVKEFSDAWPHENFIGVFETYVNRNPKRIAGKWVVTWRSPCEGVNYKVFHGTPGGLNRASKFATAKQYDMIAARGGLDTAWGQKAYRELRDAFQEAFEGDKRGALVTFSKDLNIGFKFDTSEGLKVDMRRNPKIIRRAKSHNKTARDAWTAIAKSTGKTASDVLRRSDTVTHWGFVMRNPVKSGAKRKPSKRIPAKKYQTLKLRPGEDEAIMGVAERAGRSIVYKYEDDGSVSVSGHYSEMRIVREALRRLREETKRNPVKSGAKRNPPKRNPRRASGSFVIRAMRRVKSGYLYYYLRGDQFVKDAAHADRFSRPEGEAHMKSILSKLPDAIHSITLIAP